MIARLVTVSALALMALLAAPAGAATTCTARHKSCLDFCAKSYKGPGATCTSQCADALPQCMSSGCWVTRMANQCGLTRG